MMKSRTKRPRYKASSPQQCNILILTGSIGAGHISVARAIAEALYRKNKKQCRVEIVDFMTSIESFVTAATKKIYLGSLKISPRIYEMIFSGSTDHDWPLQFLNAISAPFIKKKVLNLIREKQPNVLVSTFPIWDIILRKIWKQYKGGKLPFISVITDSISVHNAWTIGDPDFFLVSNKDTKVSLRHLGIPERRIKVFGYPVSNRFIQHSDCMAFQQKWNLSPKRKTLLLILSTGITWLKVKKIVKTIQKSSLKNLQMLICACSNERLRKNLETVKWPWPVRITGWTNEMHTLIHGADIILTKAGGATVMECVNSQRPMVIIDAIPGQEIGNAMLVQKYNLGVVLDKDLNGFDSAIEYILSHDQLIKKNLSSQQTPHAAENIAKFLTGLARKS